MRHAIIIVRIAAVLHRSFFASSLLSFINSFLPRSSTAICALWLTSQFLDIKQKVFCEHAQTVRCVPYRLKEFRSMIQKDEIYSDFLYRKYDRDSYFPEDRQPMAQVHSVFQLLDPQSSDQWPLIHRPPSHLFLVKRGWHAFRLAPQGKCPFIELKDEVVEVD